MPRIIAVLFLALNAILTGCGGSNDPPANEPPVADAGPDIAAEERSPVTLSGRGTDRDGTVRSYLWTQVSGPAVTLEDADSAEARFTSPDAASGSADLVFRLTVTDDLGAVASDDVTVTVTFFNTPPTADAGADLVVDELSVATLTGRGQDSDGTIVSYSWVQFFGPSVTLENPTEATARFTAPAVTIIVAELVFEFTVTDDLGATASDLVSVTLNVPPRADAGPDRIVERQTPISLTGRGIDDDGEIQSYQWAQIAGPSVTLDRAGSTIRFTTPDVGGVSTDLVFRLTVFDNNGSQASDDVTITVASLVSVSGQVSFDYVPLIRGRSVGLDYGATQARPIRGVSVHMMHGGRTLDTAVSTDDGAYMLKATPDTEVFIRVRAEIAHGDEPWDVRVLDNTRDGALYAMDGEPFRTGSSDVTVNLHAASGWTGAHYGEERAAAPFAMLDVVYDAMQLVRSADPGVDFAQLVLLWSPNNVTGGGRGAYFSASRAGSGRPSAIYLLGEENRDTDEYDRSLIAHEWGHFLEATLSRSDSLGGGHGPGDQLDMRVAFSEGFANALSAMITGEDSYAASFGPRQSSGWVWDIENSARVRLRPGWFSEASVHEIVYDLFDPANDDEIEFGFGPIYEVLVKDLAGTPALTGIFPFVHALKTRWPERAAAIDALLEMHAIEPIVDAYGSAETNSGYPSNADVLPVYGSVEINGGPTQVCSTADFGRVGSSNDNRLGVRRLLRFRATEGDYSVSATGTSAADDPANPSVCLYRRGQQVDAAALIHGLNAIYRPDSPVQCFEPFSGALTAGEYVIEVFDRRNAGAAPLGRSCFDVGVSSP